MTARSVSGDGDRDGEVSDLGDEERAMAHMRIPSVDMSSYGLAWAPGSDAQL
jgi:hypothetical protein